MNHCHKLNITSSHRGVVTVEFTLVAAIFFFVLFSIIGIARILYIYNAAVNATRLGARLAVVCDITAAANIKTKMAAKVPGLNTTNITLSYNPNQPNQCTVANCTSVTVSISNFTVAIATPASFPLGNFTVPGFSTTLVRESMSSTNNSVCS